MATESTSEEAMKASDVRFFWVEGGDADEDSTYHWCVDCAWVKVAVWRGGRLVSSEAPPPGATDTGFVREFLEKYVQGPAWHAEVVDSPTAETGQERWLCQVCRLHMPIPVGVSQPHDSEPCEKCGCIREIHIHCRSPFDRGCGMAWLETLFFEDGEEQYGQIHCPCDGYAPPAGARPVTPSDFRFWSEWVVDVAT